jgi:hypothetical protein
MLCHNCVILLSKADWSLEVWSPDRDHLIDLKLPSWVARFVTLRLQQCLQVIGRHGRNALWVLQRSNGS